MDTGLTLGDVCFLNRQGDGECLNQMPDMLPDTRTLVLLWDSTRTARMLGMGQADGLLASVEAAARALDIQWDHVTLMGYNQFLEAWLAEADHNRKAKT